MTPPSSASARWCPDRRFWPSRSIASAWPQPWPRWFTSLAAWRLERLKPQPRAVALSRSLRTVWREPAIIELLPFVGLRIGAWLLQVDIEALAACRPRIVLALELRVSGEHLKLRLDVFDLAAPHWKNVAIRLALLEADRRARPREHPVHGEAVRRPVGLDDAGQRGDTVLRPVDRPLHHQLGARLGAEQARQMEGEDAVAEMADRRSEGAWVRLDHDRIKALPSPPHGKEAGVAQHLPPIGIGDVERQAAIGEALVGRVHPSLSTGAGRISTWWPSMTWAMSFM